jgi:hypothetical protein
VKNIGSSSHRQRLDLAAELVGEQAPRHARAQREAAEDRVDAHRIHQERRHAEKRQRDPEHRCTHFTRPLHRPAERREQPDAEQQQERRVDHTPADAAGDQDDRELEKEVDAVVAGRIAAWRGGGGRTVWREQVGQRQQHLVDHAGSPRGALCSRAPGGATGCATPAACL